MVNRARDCQITHSLTHTQIAIHEPSDNCEYVLGISFVMISFYLKQIKQFQLCVKLFTEQIVFKFAEKK